MARMRERNFKNVVVKQLGTLVLIVAAVAILVQPVSASPIGLLRLDSGSGGVNVTLTTIDWFPPVGPPNGSFVVSSGTTLTSAVGNPAVGSTGSMLDLNIANPLPVTGFITFPALPGLAFDLASIGPGSANTNCASVTSIGQSCSPFLGSPFILTLTPTGTGVLLGVGGTAHDGTPPNSTWLGTLSTQITVLSTVPAGTIVTPLDIQNFFGCTAASVGPGGCTNQNALITSSYSGELNATVTAIPEPTTFLLLGGGFVGLAAILARRRKRA